MSKGIDWQATVKQGLLKSELKRRNGGVMPT